VNLDADEILARAADRAGRPADASPDWVSALHLLVDSAANEGGLTEPGAAALATKLEQLAAERLSAEAILADHPDITARPVEVRFAVAGMGRSGTTLLQRLLSCDPDVAFLPTWQAMHPVPPTSGEDTRRADVIRFIDELASTNPAAMRIHPLEADAPEEEVFLLQHSFASMLFPLTCPLPSYNEWLSSTDHRDAYHFAFDLLRLNEWAGRDPTGRPRVMKSPQFLLDLDVVLQVAPDAVIAQTHRDPVDLVGSYCSTYANSRRRSVAEIDLPALGQERLGHLGLMADRAIAVRDRVDAGRFVDVHYAELVGDPFVVVEALYDRAGIPLTAAARSGMRAWLDAHPQHQAGRHDYDLADYGLDRATVEARFAAYLQRFQVVRDDS
jgi:hypothetical protein